MAKRVVFVTGGSSGIGLATCSLLNQHGLTVYGSSRKANNGDTLNGISMVKLDVTNLESVHEAIKYIISKEGRIDVLVNNAGLGMAGSVEDASTDEILKIFHTNVFGAMECCRAVIPHMRRQGGGYIVNISSIAGEFGLPFRGIYSASKGALDRFSETMRMELKPSNIKVSIVQPGDVRTNINANRVVAARSLTPESPYKVPFEKMYAEISREVASAQDPARVATIILKIINRRNPRMRYPAATLVQRLSISLNRILPKHIFQSMLLKRYPVE
jgi:NAD(P)-dependent dehydrogenase (short-subunit alcohol dehydrogenase family)